MRVDIVFICVIKACIMRVNIVTGVLIQRVLIIVNQR